MNEKFSVFNNKVEGFLHGGDYNPDPVSYTHLI